MAYHIWSKTIIATRQCFQGTLWNVNYIILDKLVIVCKDDIIAIIITN